MISLYNRKDHGWRDGYNPLRGLSMGKLVSLLEAGERGEYADLAWFYHYMERSDAMIYSVLQRRRAALLAVDWDIRLSPHAAGSVSEESPEGGGQGFDQVLAEEQAAFLTESGSGTLAGTAHRETFLQIARSDAVLLSGALQRDIDVPLLNKFFPGKPVLAYFEFSPGTAEESAQIVEDAVKLAGAGYRMDADELSAKTGYVLEGGG